MKTLPIMAVFFLLSFAGRAMAADLILESPDVVARFTVNDMVRTNSDGTLRLRFPGYPDEVGATITNFVHRGMLSASTVYITNVPSGYLIYSNADGGITKEFTHRTNAPAPQSLTAPMYGPRSVGKLSEIALQWPVNPDCDRYRVEYKSSLTTNRWTTYQPLFTATNAMPFINVSVFLDMSVPVWTRIIGITENGQETFPTNPVRHPEYASPRPMEQHQEIPSVSNKSIAHRSRLAMPIVLPPLPP